jgi:hypothetical protein
MATSLLDWILDLLRDSDAREAFQDDPEGYARANGFGDLSSSDVYDALHLAAGGRHDGHDGHDGQHLHYPPPRHPDHDGGHHGGHDGVRYLDNYIRHDYKVVDDRDTDIDTSTHQRVDTDGGDFRQTIDNDPVVASGDGAVAAGDDIRDSQVTSGDGNVVGDHNQAVTGHDNTTAFGSGNATKASFEDARFGDGAGVSVGGDADGRSEDNDTSTSVRGGDGATSVNAAGEHGYANQHADQSHTDNSSDVDYESHTRVEDNSEHGSHNDAHFEVDAH